MKNNLKLTELDVEYLTDVIKEYILTSNCSKAFTIVLFDILMKLMKGMK